MKTLADRKIEIGTEVDAVRLLLKDQEFAATYADYLHPSLFREQLRSIVEIALTYWKQYRKLCPNTALVQELRFKVGTGFTEEKLKASLETLYQLSVDPVAPKYTEDTIASFIRFQRMENAITKSVDLLDLAEQNRDMKKLDEIQSLITRAGEKLNTPEPEFFFAGIDKRTDKRKQIESGEAVQLALGSGIPELDDLRKPHRGLLVGELGVWVAATGRGKSIALLHNAICASSKNYPVAYFSLELPEEMLLDRADAMFTRTEISKLVESRNIVRDEMMKKLEYANFGEIAFRELPCTGVTVNEIYNELITLREKFGFEPKLVCVDYMDLMLPSKASKEGGWKQQQVVTQELRAMGGEVGAAVWTASQGNRGAAAKNDEGELLGDSDVAESYLKLGVADWVITINRTKKQMEMPEPRPAWLNPVKNRTGIANKRIGILTDFGIMSFYEGMYEENPLEQLEEAALESGAFEGKKKSKKKGLKA